MSMRQQLWFLGCASVVLALCGALWTGLWAARAAIEEQQGAANQRMAQGLVSPAVDPDQLRRTLVSQINLGIMQEVRLSDGAGRPLEAWQAMVPAVPAAPAWFRSLFPLDPQPGMVIVGSDAPSAALHVDIWLPTQDAYGALWSMACRWSLWLSAWLVLCVLVVIWLARKPLRAVMTVARQAQDWLGRRPTTVPEPDVPEMRPIVGALNSMAQRQRDWLEEQAAQHSAMRREATCDPVTGLAHRRHFLATLASQLSREGAQAQHGVLVLLRLQGLELANQRRGRREVDAALSAVSAALSRCVARHPGPQEAFAGRLNGPDFGVCFPGASAVAACGDDVMAEVEAALEAQAPAMFDDGVAVGSTGYAGGDDVSTVLAVADEALAQAEFKAGRHVALAGSEVDQALGGEGQWRRQIAAAIERADIDMVTTRVVDRQRGLVHLECHVRLALAPGAVREGPDRWLPLAIRTDQVAQVDLAALGLALAAIDADRQPRCLGVSPASLSAPDFVARVEAALHARPDAAAQLSFDVSEEALLRGADSLRLFGSHLKTAGSSWGLVHAGRHDDLLSRLGGLPLDYLKLDASVIAGVEEDAAVRQLVRTLVSTAHGLGILVYAEHVDSDAQAQALLGCGIDGWSGAAEVAA